MEDLIKQAFTHVEFVGPHVEAGHYDLIGPDGEIILPSVWEKTVHPGWQIKMAMWPGDKPPRAPPLEGQPSAPGMRNPRGGPGMVEIPDGSRPQRKIARLKGRLNHLIPTARPPKKSFSKRFDSTEYIDSPLTDQAELKKPSEKETRFKAGKEPRDIFAGPKEAEEEENVWETD